MTFVGREAELDAIAREFALAVDLSVGRSLFLFGPPGVGKSTLIGEALERAVRARPGLAIARGRCLQTFGSGDPYLPFVNALEDLADESTLGFVNKDTLSGLLTELAPYWLQVVPLVGNLLSATFSTAARLRQTSQGAAPSREALFVQYLEVIRRLAERSPLILVLDDLHWADQASVTLLAHVARGVERLPVLVIGTFRTGEVEYDRHPVLDLVRELERESIGKRLLLGELDEAAATSLMAAEFGGDVSEPLRRWMLQTAGANPLFVSELARLLKQAGAVELAHDEWQLTPAIETVEVPRSAEAVIETRIQKLDAESIRVLQYASIEGNEFDSTVLAGLLELDELELLDRLEQLERRHQLIQSAGELDLPDGDVATLYRFRHALVQTVLYRQVVGKRRLLLHRKAGEALERLFRDSPEEVAGKLARHFHQGRVAESAYRYARLAADRARRLYAHWEAEEFFRIALETSTTDEDRADLWERLGDVYEVVGAYDRALDAFGQALELGAADAKSLRLRRKAARVERKSGQTPVPALLQRVRALLAEADAHPRERCELLIELTLLPTASGVIEAATEAIRIAEELDDPLLLVDALQRLALAQIFGEGSPADAFPHLQRVQELLEQIGDPVRSAVRYTVAGIAHAKLGAYRDAQREFEGTLAMAERTGDPQKVASACNNLGAVMIRLGVYDEAKQLLHRAHQINERRDRSNLVSSLFNLAERSRLLGDLAAASGYYEQLLDCARSLQHWGYEAVAHAGLGLCELESGQLEEARSRAWQAISVVADREEWFEDRDVLERLLARLEELDGQPAEAIARLGRAAASLQTVDVFLWAMVELERARLLRDEDPHGAHGLLLNVITGTSRLQSPLLERQIALLRDSLAGFETTPVEHSS